MLNIFLWSSIALLIVIASAQEAIKINRSLRKFTKGLPFLRTSIFASSRKDLS